MPASAKQREHDIAIDVLYPSRMASRSGQCLCGAVKFHAEDPKTEHGACHCGMCQRWTSGPFLSCGTKSVTFEGEENITRYESSDWAERGFCKKCGSTLFYYFKRASFYSMSVGAFDDRSAFKLAREIFVDHKAPGYSFAGDHPRLTEAEVLARMKK